MGHKKSLNRVICDWINSFSHVRRQAITWSNAGILSIVPLRETSVELIFLIEENAVCQPAAIVFRR